MVIKVIKAVGQLGVLRVRLSVVHVQRWHSEMKRKWLMVMQPTDNEMKRKWPMVMQPTGKLLLLLFLVMGVQLDQEGRLARTRTQNLLYSPGTYA